MIKNSGENLLNIINDIIDISKIESGQLQIKKETFDLHNLLGDIRNICINLMQQKKKSGIELMVKYGIDDDNFFINADPYRLQQILLNLLTNAIKFTEKGYIEIQYIIKDQKTLMFEVKDSGQGIDPKHKNIIFESSVKRFGGTGLGLAITKSLITMMKGEIWFESEPGEGSTFFFTLPCEFKTLKAGVHF
jgi:signal transduction histidine kinase